MNEPKRNTLNPVTGSSASEVLPLPDMGKIEGSPMPKPEGSMRVDTLDGTSRYFAKRFAKFSTKNK